MPIHVLQLNDELLQLVTTCLLAESEVRAVLRFCQSCKKLRTVLAATRTEAKGRRLRWDRALVYNGIVKDHEQTLKNDPLCWAVGHVLPSRGETTVTLRVDRRGGSIAFGVAAMATAARWSREALSVGSDDDNSSADEFRIDPQRVMVAWGFDPCTASTCSFVLLSANHDIESRSQFWNTDDADPTDDYPTVRSRPQFAYTASTGYIPRQRVENWGQRLALTIDHRAGTIAYQIDEGEKFLVFQGFPPSTVLYPWVRLYKGPLLSQLSNRDRRHSPLTKVRLVGWI